MEAYTSFAEVYDTFMDNVPYEEWADYLQNILKEYDIFDGLVLELGCGTGNMTELLAEKGYDMIGVDNSEPMLELAMEKRIRSGHDILYLLQDMQSFELYGTVKAVVSVCDSVNYIRDDAELTEVFKLFVQSQEDSDLYRRYQEIHQQKAYTLEKIKTLIEKAGLRYIAAYDAYTKKAPMYTSGRVCVIAQEYGK